MANKYERRDTIKAIVLALRNLGGSASRKQVRAEIASNSIDDFTEEDVFGQVTAKSGNKYSPFMFDFNFGIQGLVAAGFIEGAQRGVDLVLTKVGRDFDMSSFPTHEIESKVSEYWDKKHQLNKERKAAEKETVHLDEPESVDSSDAEDVSSTKWKSELLDCLKKFSPAKFESFSRLLINKMGVQIDKERGIVKSGDHGIDGFGYFTSDEFRTSRVAIQCKRYTDNSVSEPEIDKFKGVMDGFNAEYGIFVTTSQFTAQAIKKARQGNNTVTLIDGQTLADLVQKYELHITPIKTYALDDYYFEEN
ncbi:restriction endonuclease [Lentilactobacillus curieae]|uniref:Restriction endonuclease n=1 Tax=Lentilactobacillus curieae TaxID=1138822 RepID=A0A1S6QH75_9LACO|nr:restriction endonuclease [Lentilactobacillus curieae]AQW20950.1 restriction endonuclease [Lentilactobacillus curieae]